MGGVPSLVFSLIILFEGVKVGELGKNNLVGIPVGTRVGCNLTLIVGVGELEDEYEELVPSCSFESTSEECGTASAEADHNIMMTLTKITLRKGYFFERRLFALVYIAMTFLSSLMVVSY